MEKYCTYKSTITFNICYNIYKMFIFFVVQNVNDNNIYIYYLYEYKLQKYKFYILFTYIIILFL